MRTAKKWLSLLLVLVLAASLFAGCSDSNPSTGTQGNNNDNSTTSSTSGNETANSEPTEPTDAERAMLQEYADILKALANYPNSFDWVNATGITSATLGEYRDALLAMEDIDYWLAKPGFLAEYCNISEELACDRQTFLARFAVLEDAFLGYSCTTTDNLGNKSTDNFLFFCDEDGSFLRGLLGNNYSIPYETLLLSQHIFGSALEFELLYRVKIFCRFDMQFTYNEDGSLASVTDRDTTYATGFDDPDSRLSYITEFAYDANGRRVSATYTASGKNPVVQSYVYDTDGNCLISGGNETNDPYLTLTYDSQGRVIREALCEVVLPTMVYPNQTDETLYVAEYIYNADGTVATMTYQHWDRHRSGKQITDYVEQEDVFTYHYDAQGRLSSVSIAVGEVKNADGTVKTPGSTMEIDLLYGSYYFYSK